MNLGRTSPNHPKLLTESGRELTLSAKILRLPYPDFGDLLRASPRKHNIFKDFVDHF